MVTAATRAQLQRVTDKSGVLMLLMLEHPDITTVRLVNDTRNWPIGADTWLGVPFRFKLPNDTAGQAPRAMLEMDNVGGDVMDELELLTPGAALQATVRMVSRATPTVVDYEFSAPLSNVTAGVFTVASQLGNDDALRAPAVKVRFDPTVTPGLFAG